MLEPKGRRQAQISGAAPDSTLAMVPYGGTEQMSGPPAAAAQNQQMCLIGAHFKRVRPNEPNDPNRFCNESSIMRTKVLSIMPVEAMAVRSD